jgi:putative membrane protein
MSNERTQLSYLRTSLSLMSFGITLNRFSIFLRESKMEVKTHGILMQTEFIGLGMVVMGIILLGWSHYHYLVVEKEIDTGTFKLSRGAMSFFSIAILFLGGIITVWMFVNRG